MKIISFYISWHRHGLREWEEIPLFVVWVSIYFPCNPLFCISQTSPTVVNEQNGKDEAQRKIIHRKWGKKIRCFTSAPIRRRWKRQERERIGWEMYSDLFIWLIKWIKELLVIFTQFDETFFDFCHISLFLRPWLHRHYRFVKEDEIFSACFKDIFAVNYAP